MVERIRGGIEVVYNNNSIDRDILVCGKIIWYINWKHQTPKCSLKDELAEQEEKQAIHGESKEDECYGIEIQNRKAETPVKLRMLLLK